MRNLFILIMIVGLLALGSTTIVDKIIGTNYYITGCEKGVLLTPTAHLWEEAEYSHVIGTLLATSKYDECKGTVVKLLDAKIANGHIRYKVKSIKNGRVGWVHRFFIGEKVE